MISVLPENEEEIMELLNHPTPRVYERPTKMTITGTGGLDLCYIQPGTERTLADCNQANSELSVSSLLVELELDSNRKMSELPHCNRIIGKRMRIGRFFVPIPTL
jgi:hypothetical protein